MKARKPCTSASTFLLLLLVATGGCNGFSTQKADRLKPRRIVSKLEQTHLLTLFRPCLEAQSFRWTSEENNEEIHIVGTEPHTFKVEVRGVQESVRFSWRAMSHPEGFESLSESHQEARPPRQVIWEEVDEEEWPHTGHHGVVHEEVPLEPDPCDPRRLVVPGRSNKFMVRFKGLDESSFEHNQTYDTLIIDAVDESGAELRKEITISLAKPLTWCDSAGEGSESFFPYEEGSFTYTAKYGFGTPRFFVTSERYQDKFDIVYEEKPDELCSHKISVSFSGLGKSYRNLGSEECVPGNAAAWNMLIRALDDSRTSISRQVEVAFRISNQYCFGAIGSHCNDFMSTCFDVENGERKRCRINIGSWRHDQCCIRYPNGYWCNESWSQDHCYDEFEEGMDYLPVAWTREVQPEVNNTTGCVDFDSYCAEEGSLMPKDHVQYCCSKEARRIECNLAGHMDEECLNLLLDRNEFRLCR